MSFWDVDENLVTLSVAGVFKDVTSRFTHTCANYY